MDRRSPQSMFALEHRLPYTSSNPLKSTTTLKDAKYVRQTEASMSRLSISVIGFLIVLSASHVLTGCATRKEKILPHGDSTMLDIWNQKSSSHSQNARSLLDAREILRRPLIDPVAKKAKSLYEPYTRTAENEIDSLFPRLPNPDLVM